MVSAHRWLVVLVFSSILNTPLLVAGQAGAADAPSPEERLRAVEMEQQYLRQGFKDTQDATRFLITGFAALMVLIQVISSIIQARREDRAYVKQAEREDLLERRHANRENELETSRREREDQLDARRSQREQQLFSFWTEREKQVDQRRMEREDRLDVMTGSSVQSVKNVLDVVYSTFEERRKAEEQGRRAAEDFDSRVKTLTDTIATLNAKISNLEGFADGVRRTVENEQQTLERRALSITKTTPRHLFRQRAALLSELAREYESFIAKQGLGESVSGDGTGFSVYVSYIRGIAAHYANDPKVVTPHLTRVAADMTVQPGEDDVQRDKRRAVAYYFLGLTESNFGNYSGAVEAFQHAIDLERTPKDVLSRLVAAEAAALGNRVIDAHGYLQQVDEIIQELREQHEAAKTQLPISFRRHGYRATLIRANIAITAGREQWDTAVALLSTVSDPHEYFASATLAQLLLKGDPASKEAHELFENAYRAIRDLGHLHTVAEVRSRILLLLVAGMSARYTAGYTAMMEEHLVEAEGLLPSLPERDGQSCTVYSPLSKRNVDKSAILADIEAVRRGSVLREG